MIRLRYRVLLLSLLLSPALVYSDPPIKRSYKRSGNGVRLCLGTSLNYYSINENHAANPEQKISGTFSFRRELRVAGDYRAYLLFGADYVFHGLNYQSYYFKPDSIHLYDKKFRYKYSLFLNEFHFPVAFKYLFRREDNSPYSPYFIIGYHLRYMLPGVLKVSENGEVVKEDIPEVKFKTSLISNKINALVSAGLGWQKNNMSDRRGSFVAELNFQYGFSQYYFNTDYSAASMFINCLHVTLLVGVKI